MKNSNWTTENIPDQTGRITIVTGSNSGIGFEAAKVLAAKGADVVLAVRNQEKGDQAKAEIIKGHAQAKVTVSLLDLSSLKSVKAFSEEFANTHTQLDLLINNAGIMIPPYGKTEDGFESQMGTNHLGHFALTAQLFPLLKNTRDSRIVNVSSTAHNMGSIDFDDLQWESRKYVAWKAYGDSKIANLYFTNELGKRMKAAGLTVTTTAAHPGYAATGLQKGIFLKFLNVIVAQSGFMGATPTLMAAIDPEASSGDFYGPSGIAQQRGWPKQVVPNKLSQDDDIAKKLWSISEELTAQPFNI
ncbi:MAG: SDR family oxidoreductase [Candidatus Marinimicrobia bacterium]|jgi:NAD(P)-dependent dehydrogenase (short-subunit alcohol dehydrogenase family)|nr:SDR family oxidoreductase [Candidatus Neomarinimicrobiota bacterium]MBT3576927.1 SDR family oxidoreductase [Candidatus Neomarinimicrobiota bacterium]MBT3681380.1 SDR family oxidoreductase [Candidatus Neomarinimicrobiota bacterium]MBT3951274.1 SDR family oxidoreductase [Candidatus Neomarinimicrobiota bacterium]MBT4254418.1 SDR family oxidoreductase [Candidatus Neomarinimicrobiota bacterium]